MVRSRDHVSFIITASNQQPAKAQNPISKASKMHFTSVAALTLSLATTALSVGTVSVLNQCSTPIYLTITRQDQSTTQYELNSTVEYSEIIAGSGNSYGVTNTSDYYSSTTAKLILGVSDDPSSKLVYWSVSSVDGNPVANDGGFSVSAPGPQACSGTNSLNGQVYACSDTNSLQLVAC